MVPGASAFEAAAVGEEKLGVINELEEQGNPFAD